MSTWHTHVSRASRVAVGAVLFVGATLGLSGVAVAADSTNVAAEKETRGGPPGDNGTVKVHDATTPDSDMRNEPRVCEFTLVGSKFDPEQKVTWEIREWPPGTGAKDRPVVLDGELTLDDAGHGSTGTHTLPDGHYKLFWNFEGQKGRAKQKVFWVDCATADKPSEEEKETGKGGDGDKGEETEEKEAPQQPGGTSESGAEESGKGGEDGAKTGSGAGPEGETAPSADEGDAQGPSPAAEADEQKATTSGGGGLPVTGAALAGLVAAGLAAIGGGGAAMYSARKKKAAAQAPADDEA
ncbi:hypothetical protein HNR23_003042 [Nocardiopsis mwathae]|uniref:LPXTG cell wall anchor domain-containing protein n=1 Tax=Nocardiopsis mwathae TaxID=1472723 RepID=A0A7X0D5Z5_9ACTN|nr:hypothetical protein [Nocardiopsis mwathae]MBB6172982.1 hypothetical protein [Nocardiopsis mwathae]